MSARSIPKRENEVTAESVCADLPEGWAISSVGDCFHDVRNGTTATQKKYAENRRIAYKLALLECRRALKEEKKLIGK